MFGEDINEQTVDDGAENYNIKAVGNIIGKINFLSVDILSADGAMEVQSYEDRDKTGTDLEHGNYAVIFRRKESCEDRKQKKGNS